MYKDIDKQREAQREWVRQKRIDKKGSTTQGSTVPDKLRFNVGEVSKPIVLEVHPSKPKRGKAIKVFADLAPDVQQTIISMTTDKHGKMDKMARANRTSIAINYQHLHPDRYYLTGAGAETPWERDGQETIG